VPKADPGGTPPGPPGAAPVQVLVVDDSALMREGMAAVLSEQGGMRVAVAADPVIAMSKIKVARPDVIVLDLEMPRMNGLTFLRKIMSEDPIPVVVCSGFAGPGSEKALRALGEGAVEIVTKPTLGVREFLQEEALRLVDSVRAAAQARLPVGRAVRSRPRRTARPALHAPPGGEPAGTIVAIGASTGGPEGLRTLLGALPADAPGIVVAQHMPGAYTGAFAARLDQDCRLAVKQAEDGDRLERGRVLIAPGDRHMLVDGHAPRYVVRLTQGPLVCRHRPSVDLLFRSVAATATSRAVGVLLTGMGDDGAAGLLEMRRAGAATISQDESTCVVFGMPKQAIARGAAERVLPLPRIPGAILWLDRDRTRRCP
jgi:two-component system chemotaxis response regulator CheB